ncbi:MAG: hypothetical protein AAFX79_11930 [Planctomycetota bacterium]
MLKFLRKHTKWLLIIFGVFLMVAFTAPQAITQLSQGLANPTVATLDGKDIDARTLAEAERQMDVAGFIVGSSPAFAALLDDRNTGLHWIMLTTEAERAGLMGIREDGRLWLEELAEPFAFVQLESELSLRYGRDIARQLAGFQWNSLDPEIRQARIDQAFGALQRPPPGTSEREYHEALSAARGVQRLIDGYWDSAALSDARARRESARIQRTASVEAFWIEAARFADAMGEPTAEQLDEHYARFASTDEGGGEFGIGYTLPPRVTLEILQIDRAAIEAGIEPDSLEVRKRYQLQAREDERAGREPPPFADARERIASEMRREMAEDVIRVARQAFVAAMSEATRELQSDGPYKRLPEGFAAQRPSFETIARRMVEAVALTRVPLAEGGRVELPEPTVIRPEGWQTFADVSAIEGFASAILQVGSTPLPASQAIFAVRELRADTGGRLAIQAGLPAADSPVVDAAGNVYFYTVLDVRDRSEPDDRAEIAERLVDDWRTLQAFQRLEALASQTRNRASTAGLTAAALQLAEVLPGDIDTPELAQLTVTPAQVAGAPPLNQPAFRDEIMAIFDALDPLVDVETVPPEQRTFAQPVPSTLTLGVGIVRGTTPLTIEDYLRSADLLNQNIRFNELRSQLVDGPFVFEAMRERLGLEIVSEDDDPRDAAASESEPEAETETATGEDG